MAHDIIENCEKYVVRRIINPGVYWVFKSHSKAKWNKEMEEFNNFLTKNVEKIADPKRICVGKIIAVKIEEGFKRGVIIDNFNRKGTIKFLILLIDYGDIIESAEAELFWIKGGDLIDKKSSAIQVSLQGIQPVAYDLEYDYHFMDGLFKRRVQKKWSVSAYKYVHSIFEKNPCIYVRAFSANSKEVSGEIFFVKERGEAPVSLGQDLCDKGFASFSEAQTPASKQVNRSIDRIISTHSMVRQPTTVLKNVTSPTKEKDLSKNNCLNSKANISQQSKTYKAHNYSSDDTTENKMCASNLKFHSFGSTFRSKLKSDELCHNTLPNSLTKSHWNSDVPESTKKSGSSSNASSGMFQIVQRSLAIYEKQKLESKGSCNNSDKRC